MTTFSTRCTYKVVKLAKIQCPNPVSKPPRFDSSLLTRISPDVWPADGRQSGRYGRAATRLPNAVLLQRGELSARRGIQ